MSDEQDTNYSSNLPRIVLHNWNINIFPIPGGDSNSAVHSKTRKMSNPCLLGQAVTTGDFDMEEISSTDDI